MNDNNHFSTLASPVDLFSCSRFWVHLFRLHHICYAASFQVLPPKKRRKEKKLLHVLHRSQWTIIYRNRGHKSQIDVRKMNNKFTNTNENKSRRLFISFLFMIYFDCLLNDVLTPYCCDNTMRTIQNELKRKCSFSFNKNRVESHEMRS